MTTAAGLNVGNDQALEPEPRFADPERTQKLDWSRLGAHLASEGHVLDLTHPPRQFASGLANLNFLIRVNGEPVVLRRPPHGPLAPGANDMKREHRVLSRLYQAYPLAPRSLHLCEDHSVLGAPFQLIEYRPGLVVGSTIPEALIRPGIGEKLSDSMVQLLCQLHAVRPCDVGLETLGKPAGFLDRAIQGWHRRAALVMDPADCRVLTLLEWMQANTPNDQPATLLHCDFKLDNIIWDGESLAARAVLDWDMCTQGDPLFDLATLLSYWTEPGDPPVMHALGQMPTAAHGFWPRSRVIEEYSLRSGRDVSNFKFYRVLALFKLAIVFLQLHFNHREGGGTDPRYAEFRRLGDGLLDHAANVQRGVAL